MSSHGQILFMLSRTESTTTRKAGGVDFIAVGDKRQGREVPQSLRVKPGAKHPVWKTQTVSKSRFRYTRRDTITPLPAFENLKHTSPWRVLD